MFAAWKSEFHGSERYVGRRLLLDDSAPRGGSTIETGDACESHIYAGPCGRYRYADRAVTPGA